jgi:NDP-sugar pyrophosphorylase family protein
MVPALVLTAGLATRLRPLSLVRAKAAIPVGAAPLAARILRALAEQGVTDAVLNLHHLPASLTARIGDGAGLGVRVRYSWESPAVLGSAGGIRHALPLMGASRLLVVNGDTLTNVALGPLLEAHARSGALVTLAVIPNTMPQRYGGILTNPDGTFRGTVGPGSATPSHHFVGVQVVEAAAFEALADGVPEESIRTVYPHLVATNPRAVRVHSCAATFLDIGTPADYVQTCRALSDCHDASFLERGARVRPHPTAHVADTVAWDDVTIAEGARVTRSILTDGVAVPAGTTWDSVIIRRAATDLMPGEQRIGQIAVSALPTRHDA